MTISKPITWGKRMDSADWLGMGHVLTWRPEGEVGLSSSIPQQWKGESGVWPQKRKEPRPDAYDAKGRGRKESLQ
jgi:hypothetical protein